MIMEKNKPFAGTDLKYLLEIEAEGFSMQDNDFKIVIHTNRGNKEIKKEDMRLTEDEEFIFTVNTKELGAGEYILETIAYVPDDDFDSGIRTEVQKQLLCVVAS